MKLLIQGEKLCFDTSGRKSTTSSSLFLKKIAQKVSSGCLMLLVSKKILFGFVFLTRIVKTNGEIV